MDEFELEMLEDLVEDEVYEKDSNGNLIRLEVEDDAADSEY